MKRPTANPVVRSYAAELLLRNVRALLQEVDGVRGQGESDIEPIHRMRVASRRVRTALILFGDYLPPKKAPEWRKQLSALSRALSVARDLDVQIDVLIAELRELDELRNRPGLRRLLLRLRQQRLRRQRRVLTALKEVEKRGTLTDMETRLTAMNPRLPEAGEDTTRLFDLADARGKASIDSLLVYESSLQQPDQVQAHHAMRIAAKRLRYTLETFAPLFDGGLDEFIQELRRCQTYLGDIHDCDVWLDFLPAFETREHRRMEKYLGHTRPFKKLQPGLTFFAEDRRAARVKRFEQFGRVWEAYRTNGLWERLADALAGVMPESPAVDDEDLGD